MTGTDVGLRALDHLQDEEGDIVASADALKRWIRQAYNDVVLLMDEAPMPMNLLAGPGQAPASVTWSGTAREVMLEVTEASRIMEVCPLSTDGRELPPYAIVPYPERNSRQTGVYIYRGFTSDAKLTPRWFIGQCAQARSGDVSAHVYFRPAIDEGPYAYPGVDELVLVPSDLHEAIAVRTALLIKLSENRDATVLIALWRESKEAIGRFGAGKPNRPSYRY
jgi:hypothetical protein